LTTLARRIFVYVGGMLLIAFGVGLAVKSNLGISPVNSIPYVLSQILNIDQGAVTTFVFYMFIVVQILLLRKEFALVQLCQIICATVFGSFVSVCNRILTGFIPQAYLTRLLLTGMSILFIACGMFLYLCTKLIPQPAEGLCLAIQKKTGWKYSSIKVICDCSFVFVAGILSYVCTGTITGLGEGTLLTMLSVGRLIGILSARWQEQIEMFCFR